jgi:hypothetical protein
VSFSWHFYPLLEPEFLTFTLVWFLGGRSIHREQEDQVIRVIDQGPGINEDEREAVFSPYYRGKLTDTSPVQGSGLGLSTARYLTELHDGTLAVQPDTVSGAMFVLRLPASSLDLLDGDPYEDQITTTEVDEESLWPREITKPTLTR